MAKTHELVSLANPARLQEELHSGKSLVQTEAGTEIREELARLEAKLRAKHAMDISDLKLAQEARKDHFLVI